MKAQATNEMANSILAALITRPLATLCNLTILQHRYFIGSLVLYLVILLSLRNHVITPYLPTSFSTFKPEVAILVRPPLIERPPPIREQFAPKPHSPATDKAMDVETKQATLNNTRQNAGNRITMTVPSPVVVPVAPIAAPVQGMAATKMDTELRTAMIRAEADRIRAVLNNQSIWFPEGAPRGSGSSGRYTSGAGKGLVARFTIFQAKYQDGDWNCNPEALKNLLLQIRAWSRKRIDANLHPEVLDVGTDQLFVLKPPFVYLTGHRDFRLQEQEVKNLRDYLMLGGAIWADSALAGRRSRFDLAFRREIGRVLPDRDFETVKPDHDLFDTFFEHIGLPSGMNSYEEPVEAINIGNELAVLYTPNGYGHFWESRLNRDNKIEWGLINTATNSSGNPVWNHVIGPHLSSPRTITETLYRNINDKTVCNADKFGINVVVHLLTRYQKYRPLAPLELPAASARRNPERNPIN